MVFKAYTPYNYRIASSCKQDKLSQMESEYKTCVKKVQYQVIFEVEIKENIEFFSLIVKVFQIEPSWTMCADQCFSGQLHKNYSR